MFFICNFRFELNVSILKTVIEKKKNQYFLVRKRKITNTPKIYKKKTEKNVNRNMKWNLNILLVFYCLALSEILEINSPVNATKTTTTTETTATSTINNNIPNNIYQQDDDTASMTQTTLDLAKTKKKLCELLKADGTNGGASRISSQSNRDIIDQRDIIIKSADISTANQPKPTNNDESSLLSDAAAALVYDDDDDGISVDNYQNDEQTLDDDNNSYVIEDVDSVPNDQPDRSSNIRLPYSYGSIRRQPPPLIQHPQQMQPQHHQPHQTSNQRHDINIEYTKEIQIKQGRLKGLVRSMHLQSGLNNVNQYLGIPYAAAPVGSGRFMPPGMQKLSHQNKLQISI